MVREIAPRVSTRWQIALVILNYSVKNVVKFRWQMLRLFSWGKSTGKICEKSTVYLTLKNFKFITMYFWDRCCTKNWFWATRNAPKISPKKILQNSHQIKEFTYVVVSEGVFAEILRKVYWYLQKCRFIASGKRAEILRKVAEISRKCAETFLQWPLPERPHKWIADKLTAEFPTKRTRRASAWVRRNNKRGRRDSGKRQNPPSRPKKAP